MISNRSSSVQDIKLLMNAFQIRNVVGVPRMRYFICAILYISGLFVLFCCCFDIFLWNSGVF